jgi:hypothetical protein
MSILKRPESILCVPFLDNEREGVAKAIPQLIMSLTGRKNVFFGIVPLK